MDYCGIRGPLNELLATDLSNQWQYISWKEIKVTMEKLTTGIPEGSLLGTWLLLLCLNDLDKCIENSPTAMFVDDSTVIENK